MRGRTGAVLLALGLLLPAPATAGDAAAAFARGARVVSLEGGFGAQNNIEDKRVTSELEFTHVGVRASLLPWGPVGGGPLRGALEVGLQPYYQRYATPVDAFFGGLGVVARYHFLAAAPLVPWADVMVAPGGTDLRVREIRSDFAVLLQGGLGLALFVHDRAALYAGYRFQHVSNGNTESPNRGFEAHTGVFGLSYFFP